MFNEDYRMAAIEDLEQANGKYTLVFKRTMGDLSRLFQSRQRAIRTIRNIERYMIQLANRPREYDTRINQVKMRYIAFENQIEELRRQERELDHYSQKGGDGALAGAVAGSTVAVFGPTAALAAATTFGVTSTGTAIATLSGAAATSAALAWLGGGAIFGLGSVAAGQAVLAAIGPIGWAVGAASLGAGFLTTAIKNKELAEKAENAARVIIRETERIKEVDAQVLSWNKETIRLSNELTKKLAKLRIKKDYAQFTRDDQHELMILMNMTEVLSKKIQETINSNER